MEIQWREDAVCRCAGVARQSTVCVRGRGKNVIAFSDARFHEQVKAGTILGARSIKPFERSRRWLRRTGSLWKFNGGKMQCADARELRDRAQYAFGGEEKTLLLSRTRVFTNK